MSPRKPPNFELGKSNKAMRPITAALIRVGESKLPKRWRKQLGLWTGATWLDAVVVGVFQAAAKGNPAAAREIREAIEGKSAQRVEPSVEEAPPPPSG